MRNPYHWQSHHPDVRIERAEVGAAAAVVCEGGGGVVLGGRGMGKSVFLSQLRDELAGVPHTHVVVIPAPPPELTVRAAIDLLADALALAPGAISTRKLFDAWFEREGKSEQLVLLFDELDRYAVRSDTGAEPVGRGFFHDLEIARRALPGLGILAAGSIGVFVFRDALASSFLARAAHFELGPFSREQSAALAAPFGHRGTPLGEDVLDALYLATGGIPALATYGLQSLWKLERRAETGDVTDAYARFREVHHEYLDDLLSSLQEPRLSEAPARVWQRIRELPGPLPRAQLERALTPATGALRLSLADVLRLLRAVGLIRVEGSVVSDDPVVAHPISNLLNLPAAAPPEGDLRHHFLRDLRLLLGRLHRSSVDFFRRDRSGGMTLVPESVFAAHLALGFELLGWRCEREAQRGAGRTDLLMRRNGVDRVLVVELKIWGRNGYREAHRQVLSYNTDDVVAAAVVQLTDAELDDWPERYTRDCLAPLGVTPERQPDQAGSPVRAHITASSTTRDGQEVLVDHLLLRLPRRR